MIAKIICFFLGHITVERESAKCARCGVRFRDE